MNSEQFRSYDVLIVGGGPAGLSTAIAAAERGCRSVAVVERRRRWGWPIQCAEMVPKLLGQTVHLERESIVQSVADLRFHFEGRPIGSLHAPAYILDRSRFETALAERAAQLGIALWQPAIVRAIAGGGALVSHRGKEVEMEARVIVGADGPNSLVRRVLTDAPMEFAAAIQYVLPLTEPSEAADIFFARDYGAGYGWLFPRGSEANVGVALPFEQRKSLRAALDGLVGQLAAAGRISGTAPTRRTCGLVPASGPMAHTVVESLLLVGDAAGQVHPLSGAGILTACACGRIAGEVISRAIARQGPPSLGEYEQRWRDLYGEYFNRGLAGRRRVLEADPDRLLEAIQSTWRIPPPGTAR